ncbi:hypothetical protein [Flagellimonas marina]|uniref:Uncharacterized protein n=1 Tax=Flagellimonas marina TaxID=1775168 RepID=A0ABV8PNN4_9FLAO
MPITDVSASHIYFPAGKSLDGSDTTNQKLCYSAAYAILKTNHLKQFEGHGLTFTISPGNGLCTAGIMATFHLVIGKSLKIFTENMGSCWRMITGNDQFRWLRPYKEVIQYLVNSIWYFYTKKGRAPLWQIRADISSEEQVSFISPKPGMSSRQIRHEFILKKI